MMYRVMHDGAQRLTVVMEVRLQGYRFTVLHFDHEGSSSITCAGDINLSIFGVRCLPNRTDIDIITH